MVNRNKNTVLGLLLVMLGALFLLNNLEVIYISNWWPVVLLGLGVAFLLGWVIDRGQTGLLLPSAILIILGCQFWFLHASWPIYILAPAVGFWLIYLLGEQDPGTLIPAFILTVIALVGWFQDSFLAEWWPVLFIVAGVILVVWRRPAQTKKSSKVNADILEKNPEDTQ